MAEQTTVSTKTALWIIGGVIALVALIAVIASGGDDDEPAAPAPTTTTTTEPASADTASDDGFDSGIAPLNCASLLTSEEAVLALEEDDPEGRLISAFQFAQGERCVHEDASESRNYVIIEPTSPADFDEGTTYLGATAETVDGVGGAAVWFGGDEAGSLTVAVESEFGSVLFRIEFGRIDITDERRLEHATDLARLMIPRFPGVTAPEPEPIEPVELEIERPTLDGDTIDLLTNLEAGIADGRWSRFDGIVATLDLINGTETDLEVIPEGGLIDASHASFLVEAAAYTQEAPAAEAAAIVERLDILFPPELREIANAPIIDTDDAGRALDPPDGVDNGADDEVALGRPTPPGRLASGVSPAQIPLDGSGGCAHSNWSGSVCTGVYGPTEAGAALRQHDYVVLGPAKEWLPFEGVTEELINTVRQGLTEAALVLDPFEAMPPITVLMKLTPSEFVMTPTPWDLTNGRCKIIVHESATTTPEAKLRQQIAWGAAACFAGQRFAEHKGPPTEPDAWWIDAFLSYVSEVAVPAGPVETDFLGGFPGTEMSKPIDRRAARNMYFFLWLHPQGGVAGAVDLIDRSPSEGGYDDVAAALANISGFHELFHTFARDVTDKKLTDGAQVAIPGQVPATAELPATPGGFADEDIDRMATERLRITVAEGEKACLSFTASGGNYRLSSRDRDGTAWDEALPGEITEDLVVVITSAERAIRYELSIDDVVDANEDCDEEEEDEPTPDLSDFEEVCLLECGSSDFFHPALEAIFGG